MAYLHVYYVTKRSWTKVLSFLVRFFQGTTYDHAGFGISANGEKPNYIHEAILSGVEKTPYEEFIAKHSYVVAEFKIPITEHELSKIMDLTLEHYGKKYSMMQLVGNAFAIMLKKCFNYIVRKNIFGNGWKKLVCSEYLSAVLNLVGAELPDGKDFEAVTLKDCFEMTRNIQKAIRMK